MSILKPPKVRFILTFGGFVIFIISNFPLGQASIHKVFAGGTGRIKSPAIIPPAS